MAENEADGAAIDIEGLVHYIQARISHDQFMSPNCCIFKTPTKLRDLNEKAYVPDAFSIGPFHHGRPEFQETEKIKRKYLQGLISRSLSKETILRDLINSVKHVEREARECYAGSIVYSSDEFVTILVIDGCFIIELFRKMAIQELREVDDPVFFMACMMDSLFHDLILLENQVPWMVLERLFDMTVDTKLDNMPLIEIVTFSIACFIEPPSAHPPIQDIRHIVDLCRKLLVSSVAGENCHFVPDWVPHPLPSATSLVEAGVKIKRGESTSILDLKCDDDVLEIPPLIIDETTETLFRNIISFEQCYPNCEPRFTSYARLLDNLIDTTKDVDILCEYKIITNWLNPEDAIRFFNKLCSNTGCNMMYYGRLYRKVNEINAYYNSRWSRWRAMLVRNYFSTPWAILSTAAAVILLILSFVQTWYTIYNK